MSRERYEENCPDCRPVLLDGRTGRVFPEDSPPMRAVMAIWGRTTKKEREAWHRVTCQNSQVLTDLQLAGGLAAQIQAVLQRPVKTAVLPPPGRPKA